MATTVQVEKGHYNFEKYVDQKRWASIWYQLKEVDASNCRTVLEVGPGGGAIKCLSGLIQVEITTLDIDSELNPDFVGSVTNIPCEDNSFDGAVAFQVLEHLKYDESIIAFKELCRVAKEKIIISLPDCRPYWNYEVYIPKIGKRKFMVPKPGFVPPVHEYDGEHYWEINKKGYDLQRIIEDFSCDGFTLKKQYRCLDNPYHRFFIYENGTAN